MAWSRPGTNAPEAGVFSSGAGERPEAEVGHAPGSIEIEPAQDDSRASAKFFGSCVGQVLQVQDIDVEALQALASRDLMQKRHPRERKDTAMIMLDRLDHLA